MSRKFWNRLYQHSVSVSIHDAFVGLDVVRCSGCDAVSHLSTIWVRQSGFVRQRKTLFILSYFLFCDTFRLRSIVKLFCDISVLFQIFKHISSIVGGSKSDSSVVVYFNIFHVVFNDRYNIRDSYYGLFPRQVRFDKCRDNAQIQETRICCNLHNSSDNYSDSRHIYINVGCLADSVTLWVKYSHSQKSSKKKLILLCHTTIVIFFINFAPLTFKHNFIEKK